MMSDNSVKDSILKQFLSSGHLRCVLASSSFSMGIDIPDVEQIIHFGVAMDCDDFLQETGRASRLPGTSAVSITLLYPRCLTSQHITPQMKEFVRTKSCRRQILLGPYMEDVESVTPKHSCCDNCRLSCKCQSCPTSPLVELGIIDTDDEEDDEEEFFHVEDDTVSETDSDIEVWRRRPVLVLPDPADEELIVPDMEFYIPEDN